MGHHVTDLSFHGAQVQAAIGMKRRMRSRKETSGP
jgi:hypothetical protein